MKKILLTASLVTPLFAHPGHEMDGALFMGLTAFALPVLWALYKKFS